VVLNGEHARRVVELFAGIFTDALEGATALAAAVVRFVMDQRARELRWQLCAPGLLAHFGFDRCRLQRLKFGFDSGDIRIDRVVEHSGCTWQCTKKRGKRRDSEEAQKRKKPLKAAFFGASRHSVEGGEGTDGADEETRTLTACAAGT